MSMFPSQRSLFSSEINLIGDSNINILPYVQNDAAYCEVSNLKEEDKYSSHCAISIYFLMIC